MTQASHIYTQTNKHMKSVPVSFINRYTLSLNSPPQLPLPATSPIVCRRHLIGSHGHGMSIRRSPCRSPAPTASQIPYFSAARTPPESCQENRRDVHPTSIPRRRRRRIPSPDSSKTNDTSFPDSNTSTGSNLALSTPPPEKNPLHGFSR